MQSTKRLLIHFKTMTKWQMFARNALEQMGVLPKYYDILVTWHVLPILRNLGLWFPLILLEGDVQQNKDKVHACLKPISEMLSMRPCTCYSYFMDPSWESVVAIVWGRWLGGGVGDSCGHAHLVAMWLGVESAILIPGGFWWSMASWLKGLTNIQVYFKSHFKRCNSGDGWWPSILEQQVFAMLST